MLDEFFKGPSDVERNSGLGLVLNGFTGYSKTTFANGVVYVYLTGNCQSNGTLYSIAYPLMANLKQFLEVQFVKIFDQYGDTREPAARLELDSRLPRPNLHAQPDSLSDCYAALVP